MWKFLRTGGFKPENEIVFGGEVLMVNSIDIDYSDSNLDEKIFEKENKETEKMLKALLPNEKIWKTKKGRLQKPVEITLNLKNIRTYGECDHTYVYSKVDEIQLIKSTTAQIKYDEEGMAYGVNKDKDVELLYEVYSKDGYANMRKQPDKNSQVVSKLENRKNDLYMVVPVGE